MLPNLINIMKQDSNILNIFKNLYPNLQIEQLDDETFREIIESIYGETLNNIINKFNKKQNYTINNIDVDDIIEKTYDDATTNIPEMLIPTSLIYLNGKINNLPVKILFDTGASSNCIFKSTVVKAGLENIIDKTHTFDMSSVNGINASQGTIWYTEIELDNISENKEKKTVFIGLNLMVINDDKELHNFDMILGINFMKSYKANIDLMTQTITLNNNIKIHFE